MGINKIKPWIHAARPKTLPLGFSCNLMGNFLAFSEQKFSYRVMFLSFLTTVLLQILSNLANDYGDYIKGADTPNRIGPKRMVQSGEISPKKMVGAIALTAILTLAAGSALIFSSFRGDNGIGILAFFILGFAAIGAAIKYTIGKHPYGYIGFGDFFVFLFFGLVGVMGTFYLQTHLLEWSVLLPAAAIGFFSVGVLNINNMRDYDNDKESKKITLVVLMGYKRARVYYLILIVCAFLFTLGYTVINFKSFYQFLFLFTTPLFIRNIRSVFQNSQSVVLNTELRNLSVSTLLFTLLLGIGSIL